MSLIKKNALLNTLLSVTQVLFPLLTFPYAARILGPSGVGQIGFVDSLTQYFILFSSLGIPLYAVREMSKQKGNFTAQSRLFSELLIIHAISTLVFVLLYFVTTVFLIEKNIEKNLFWIGGSILFTNIFIIEWFYQAKEQFSFITVRTITLRICFILILFLTVKTKSDLKTYYFLFLCLQFCNILVNFPYSFKHNIHFTLQGINIRPHIKPLLFLTACSVIGSVYVLLDNVILGLLGNTESVGYYSSATKITKVPISLINALGIVLVPSLSASFKSKDLEAVKRLLNGSFQYVFTIGVPLSIGIAATARWTVILLSGIEFLPSIPMIIIMSPIVVFIALNCVFFYQIFTPDGKEKTMVIILLISSTVSVILNLLLIPKFQHYGAAITTTITEFSVLLLSLYFSRKIYDIRINSSLIIGPIISSLPFLLIVHFVNKLQILEFFKLSISVVLCFLVYFVIQKFIFKDSIISKIQEFLKSLLVRG